MKKLLFILAVSGLVLTTSCTPESLSSDEQQTKKEDYDPGADG